MDMGSDHVEEAGAMRGVIYRGRGHRGLGSLEGVV